MYWCTIMKIYILTGVTALNDTRNENQLKIKDSVWNNATSTGMPDMACVTKDFG